ncbi:3-oxoacyl-reductase [Aulographum hederae CBS 113979]|uniref:3-oxoacyl-reductase n=1 Tax=Aulographum hederae CBS 113979 TaxID=1176131 RepID=A0A6G1GJK6_9PEZI|nr:3-oxoacyl-reductase [Aulographum hederae CBS 113979]
MTQTFGVKDRVVAVTGGGSGIGYAVVELLLSQGANVSFIDVSEKGLAEAESKLKAAGHPGQFMSCKVDVREGKQVDDWIAKTVEKLGKLDGAVNFAGVIPKCINIERVEDLNDEDWKFVIDVNLTGVMNCMRAQIKSMNNKGSIINASSIAGLAGFPKNAAYTAAKHGVIGLTRSAAKEVGDREIRVNCIAPGVIDTPMQRQSSAIRGEDFEMKWQIKRKGQPEEVAGLVAWLLCDASSFITGTIQVIDGGFMC